MSTNPRISTLTHLCLNPSGALGVSKYDGGDQTLGCTFGATVLACDTTFLVSFASFDSYVVWLFYLLSYAYASFVFISCFAYSSSGTPNFLAIATWEDVSFTDLRPVFGLRVADATV